MNSNAFNWIHHLTEWTEQISPQFKGSDWQTVAQGPATIKADLYSLPLSPSSRSDGTLFDHCCRATLPASPCFEKVDGWRKRLERNVCVCVCVCVVCGGGTRMAPHQTRTSLNAQASCHLWPEGSYHPDKDEPEPKTTAEVLTLLCLLSLSPS